MRERQNQEGGPGWKNLWLVENIAPLSKRRDPDWWAYHPEFEAFAARYRAETGHRAEDGDVYRQVVWLRQNRTHLPPGSRWAEQKVEGPPKRERCALSEGERVLLCALFGEQEIRRDDLPYTVNFERLYAKFQARTKRDCTKHRFWTWLLYLGKRKRLPEPRQAETSGFGIV